VVFTSVKGYEVTFHSAFHNRAAPRQIGPVFVRGVVPDVGATLDMSLDAGARAAVGAALASQSMYNQLAHLYSGGESPVVHHRRFGAALAVDGDWLAVGDPGFDRVLDDGAVFFNVGRVFVFKRAAAGLQKGRWDARHALVCPVTRVATGPLVSKPC
jgi:hypothetical protein